MNGAKRKRGPAIDVRKVQPIFAKYAKEGFTIKEITSRVNSELGLTLEPNALAAKMAQLRQKLFTTLCEGKYKRILESKKANGQDKELEHMLESINKTLDPLFPSVSRAGKIKAAVQEFLAELDLPEFDLPELETDEDSTTV